MIFEKYDTLHSRNEYTYHHPQWEIKLKFPNENEGKADMLQAWGFNKILFFQSISVMCMSCTNLHTLSCDSINT